MESKRKSYKWLEKTKRQFRTDFYTTGMRNHCVFTVSAVFVKPCVRYLGWSWQNLRHRASLRPCSQRFNLLKPYIYNCLTLAADQKNQAADKYNSLPVKCMQTRISVFDTNREVWFVAALAFALLRSVDANSPVRNVNLWGCQLTDHMVRDEYALPYS